MSTLSEFSSLKKFLLDKFKPPYKNIFEVWIVSRLKHLEILKQNYDKGGIVLMKNPIFKNLERDKSTIGGSILIPSIYCPNICTDLQDLLDDMFLYVHTMKEPSNIHHENIKAVNTILQYQNEYDGLTDYEKKGFYFEKDEIKQFLVNNKTIIGFSAPLLQFTTNMITEEFKQYDWEKEWQDIVFENVSEITSTKAVIPEYERCLVERKVGKTGKRLKKVLESYPQYKLNNTNTNIKDDNQPLLKGSKIPKSIVRSESHLSQSARCKVHDALLDFLEYNKGIQSTFDIGLWNMFINKGKVWADICIKAQYGAKREFYVLNFGAKAMVRVYENVFKQICIKTDNEMISIPGDRKMFKMQEIVNNALLNKDLEDTIYYINGDSTKWSAAETMECFYIFTDSFAKILPKDCITYCKNVISLWAKKEIMIPSSLQSTQLLFSEKTEYLKENEVSIKSTQNFLQGMLNYSSSLKAYVCYKSLKIFWAKIYPQSTLKMDFLVHSDDYSITVSTSNVSELKKFRVLQKILMKLHGFNDSVKKTNIHKFLMEFISLCSFNGHMTYPHIKKCKEVGMNLGCTGFVNDMSDVMSRVGEAMRVGVPSVCSYYMQRVHQFNLLRSYSLHIGGTNNIFKLSEMFNRPIECFGIPDMHPIFTQLCKGSANNFRLHTYYKEEDYNIDVVLKKLLRIEARRLFNPQFIIDSDDLCPEYGLTFFHPTYIFDQDNKLIKQFRRKIDMNRETIKDFWYEHKAYQYLKPNDISLLRLWMKCLYYKSEFSRAYSRSSRAFITLKLSTFTKTPCLALKDDYMTIKNYTSFIDKIIKAEDMAGLEELPGEDKLLHKALMHGDPTVSAIYSFFEGSAYYWKGLHDLEPHSIITPTNPSWLIIDSDPSTLLQYIFNYNDFILDKRITRNISSLDVDKMTLEKHYEIPLDNTTPNYMVKVIFNDLLLAKPKSVLCMSFARQNSNLEDFLKTQIELNTIPKTKLILETRGIKQVLHPHTGELFFKKNITYVRDNARLILDDAMLLFGFLLYCEDLSLKRIKEILNNLYISKPLSKDELSLKPALQSLNCKVLKQLGATHNEIKTYTFLSAFVLDDLEPMYDFCKDIYSYGYRWLNVNYKLMNYVSEIVNVEYMSERFNCYLLTDQNIIIEGTTKKIGIINNIWLIAQKLFNKITQNKMEKLFIIFTCDKMPIPTQEVTKTLKVISEFSKWHTVKYKGKSIHLPYFVKSLAKLKTTVHREQFLPDLQINYERSTVFYRGLKLYTVPYLSLKQTNLTKCYLDFDLSFKTCNWWLKNERLHEYYHEKDAQLTKEDIKLLLTSHLEPDNDMLLNETLVQSRCNKINLPQEKVELIKNTFRNLRNKNNVNTINNMITNMLSIDSSNNSDPNVKTPDILPSIIIGDLEPNISDTFLLCDDEYQVDGKITIANNSILNTTILNELNNENSVENLTAHSMLDLDDIIINDEDLSEMLLDDIALLTDDNEGQIQSNLYIPNDTISNEINSHLDNIILEDIDILETSLDNDENNDDNIILENEEFNLGEDTLSIDIDNIGVMDDNPEEVSLQDNELDFENEFFLDDIDVIKEDTSSDEENESINTRKNMVDILTDQYGDIKNIKLTESFTSNLPYGIKRFENIKNIKCNLLRSFCRTLDVLTLTPEEISKLIIVYQSLSQVKLCLNSEMTGLYWIITTILSDLLINDTITYNTQLKHKKFSLCGVNSKLSILYTFKRVSPNSQMAIKAINKGGFFENTTLYVPVPAKEIKILFDEFSNVTHNKLFGLLQNYICELFMDDVNELDLLEEVIQGLD